MGMGLGPQVVGLWPWVWASFFSYMGQVPWILRYGPVGIDLGLLGPVGLLYLHKKAMEIAS